MKEDGMSDKEIQDTIEQQQFLQFKKEMAKVGEKTFISRYANLQDTHADEDA